MRRKKTSEDRILEEIRKVKILYAKEFHHDSKAIYSDLLQAEHDFENLGYHITSLPTRRTTKRTGTNG